MADAKAKRNLLLRKTKGEEAEDLDRLVVCGPKPLPLRPMRAGHALAGRSAVSAVG